MIYNQITISDALLSLVPTGEFVVVGDTYDGINWLETNQVPLPSKEEIELEIENLRLRYESLEYQRKRKEKYPPLEEQLDMLWHSMNENENIKLEPFYSTIKEIKDNYPKTINT
jgi:hypothetical protein